MKAMGRGGRRAGRLRYRRGIQLWVDAARHGDDACVVQSGDVATLFSADNKNANRNVPPIARTRSRMDTSERGSDKGKHQTIHLRA